MAAIITKGVHGAATLRAPPAREGGCRGNPRRCCPGWTPCCPRWRSDVLVGVLDLIGMAHDVACQIGACPPRQSPRRTMHHSEAHRRAAPQIQALMEEPLGPMMAACCCMASWRPRQQGQSGVAGRHINRGKWGVVLPRYSQPRVGCHTSSHGGHGGSTSTGAAGCVRRAHGVAEIQRTVHAPELLYRSQ